MRDFSLLGKMRSFLQHVRVQKMIIILGTTFAILIVLLLADPLMSVGRRIRDNLKAIAKDED